MEVTPQRYCQNYFKYNSVVLGTQVLLAHWQIYTFPDNSTGNKIAEQDLMTTVTMHCPLELPSRAMGQMTVRAVPCYGK